MQFNKISKYIFTIDNFMTAEECQQWIEFCESKGFEAAGLTQGTRQVINKSIRNNQRLFYDSLELAETLWQRTQPYLPELEDIKGVGLNERFRFYKYFPGHQFKMHQDGRFRRNAKEWSVFTFMVYLNEDMLGGEMKFLDYVIKPETGKALIFRHELAHEGSMVYKGVKYVLRSDVMFSRK